MAGFNQEVGRSNNMVAAEDRGMVTVGRWAKRYGFSAAAAVEVMRPSEAHHTGTGRVGKSRLTPVIAGGRAATPDEVAAMKAFDAAAKAAKVAPPTIYEGCTIRFLSWPTSRRARRIPTERIERGARVEVHATGMVAATTDRDGRCVNYQKLSGLVIARGGAVIFSANVNAGYDDVAAIAARISGTEVCCG